KAEITGKVPTALQEKYTSRWEDLESLLGIEAFQSLFINIRTIYCKTPLRKTVLEEFRTYVYPAGQTNITPQEFIDNTLYSYTDVLNTILKASYQSERRAKEINGLLKWLDLISNGDWIPVAMLYLRQNWHNPDALFRFFTDLERLAASFMILGVPRHSRVRRYNELLTAIEGKEDLYTHNSPLQLTYDERRAVYNVLNGNIYQAYGINRVCRYVLLRLDTILSEGTASYEYPTITIEHVLPQHPTLNSDWLKRFPTKEIREKYVHRLGNLVLLSRSKNKDASNYDFIQKKQKYFASYRGVSPFVLTSQVLQQSDWTPVIIEQRQNMLMNRLCLAWGLLSSS
ncbi:MAG TPA: HNH endonuclease family protein, partial [Ktedonobacteraceae bacterium]|nr:HNH endonuclease family protein [Ktedonobacteraceae bacterium]